MLVEGAVVPSRLPCIAANPTDSSAGLPELSKAEGSLLLSPPAGRTCGTAPFVLCSSRADLKPLLRFCALRA